MGLAVGWEGGAHPPELLDQRSDPMLGGKALYQLGHVVGLEAESGGEVIRQLIG